MNIIHLTTDEKFIDGALFLFNKAFPNQNQLLVLKPPANPAIRYIKQSRIDFEIVKNKSTLETIKKHTSNADWVVIHGLNEVWANYIIKNTSKKILYVVWGAEVYGNPLLYDQPLLGHHTIQLDEKLERKPLIQKIKDVINSYRFGLPKTNQKQQWLKNKKALHKIDNISIIYKDEVDFYKKNNIIPSNTNFIKFGYYPIEYFANGIDEDVKLGNRIMIGNSSSLTNNHLEVFKKLASLGVKNEIVVPLSYGDKRLAKILVKEGQKMFGKQFKPITDFMPLEQYTKLMQSCGIVIMNHYRQQAVGNIITAMYLGAKVFLDERNTIYHYLKRIGCFVYSIEELKSLDSLKNLEPYQITQNKEILLKDISSDKLVNELKTKLW
ncbi:TDP-N-acetylfucosamine:lipid II N-acetylfucosaminyltransferase [Psychroflexus sp. ALD_RP9]|uniref:TDP-N-acetylfucosamine:lipid II N-acetylfucosaminyltransferase n=1 Tax=Psychroflexus sp. ALD_RP9 TaxID=2777186 RepID=UPI001A8E1500|nr:TDP-N-acetylfucosamine:lipid II N-acetylfucosaminyltransferase [Psychroflexus sp. ALD_RP9]QSS98031.1 TDP-N-acetylfucosamine:lipid II N-acetylfucosaminyltransferase [Psychroflexus sp. ALD_RP9]